MNDVRIIVKILIDLTCKKVIVLNEILAITQNQAVILSDYNSGVELYSGMLAEKEKRIADIIELDDSFFNLYCKINERLKHGIFDLKNEISSLKKQITLATDVAVKIKIQEEQNSLLVKEHTTYIKRASSGKSITSKAIDSYKSLQKNN